MTLFLRIACVSLVVCNLVFSAIVAASEVSLSDDFVCSREYDKKHFRFSQHGSYLLCGGSQQSQYQIKVLSVLENRGQVHAFDIPFEKESVGGIHIDQISSDERHTLMVRYSGFDGHKGNHSRLFLGNNESGVVQNLTSKFPAGCTVAGYKLSPNGHSLVYSVSGAEYKTDFNTMTTRAHGCSKEMIGYYHFDINTGKTNKLLNQVSENMLVTTPLISADSQTAIITDDSNGKSIAVSLPAGKKVVGLAKNMRDSDLGLRGAFFAMGFAGPDMVFGKHLKSSRHAKVPDGSNAEVVTVVPLDGSQSTGLSTMLIKDDYTEVGHVSISASPNGEWLTYSKYEGGDLKAFYSIPSKGGEPILLSSEYLTEVMYTSDGVGVIYEQDKRMVYSRLDGSKTIVYDTRIEYFADEPIQVAMNARHPVTKIAGGRAYFKADNLSEECGKGWPGLYSVPFEGGDVVPVTPLYTKNCEVYDYAFSKDGKSIIYISSVGRGSGYIFNKADVADHEFQVELWGFKP